MLVDFRELRLLKSDFIWVGIALFIASLPAHVFILPLLYGGGVVGD
jgi:hypothetical protein